MKTVIAMLIAGFMSTQMLAGEPTGTGDHGDKYCAKMRDGRLTVVHDGNVITTEVTLNNGTKVQPDGTLTKKDGTVTMLKEGECVNMEGKVATENMKKKDTNKDNKDMK